MINFNILFEIGNLYYTWNDVIIDSIYIYLFFYNIDIFKIKLWR